MLTVSQLKLWLSLSMWYEIKLLAISTQILEQLSSSKQQHNQGTTKKKTIVSPTPTGQAIVYKQKAIVHHFLAPGLVEAKIFDSGFVVLSQQPFPGGVQIILLIGTRFTSRSLCCEEQIIVVELLSLSFTLIWDLILNSHLTIITWMKNMTHYFP